MNFFFIILFIIFFVVPAISKAGKKNKRSKKSRPRPSPRPQQSNWGASNAQMRSRGHDGTKGRTHQDLHSGDGDLNVFTEDHQARVRARDLRDLVKNRKIEKAMHGRQNRGITRAGNKGRDDWGVRVGGGGKGWVILLALAAFAYWAYSTNLLDRIIG